MDLALTDEQSQLVTSFGTLFAKSSSAERVRATEPGGHDEALWRTLVEMGAVTMAVGEDRGGWGASLVELALIAEEVGRAVVPAPLIEAQVAARLLAAVGTDAAIETLTRVLDGDMLVTVALHPSRSGVAELVPAGAVCDAVIVLDGDVLRLVPVTDGARRPIANLASAPLADLALAAGEDLTAGAAAVAQFETALDEWLTLTASALVGIGTAALELGCSYAIERRAFGSPIGVFQAVAHPLADDATNLDGARLLARKAAWALARGDARGRELASMAFAFSSRRAEAATYDALHVHGGYGFMLEYDVQLYYRRARGWPRLWGDSEAGFRRAARARYGPATGER